VAGAEVSENQFYLSSFSYDSVKKEFVSYDTPHMVSLKVQYLFSKGLAGSMFWELSTDKVGPDSLVGTAAGIMGSLDQTPNHVQFEFPRYICLTICLILFI
jgi:chitinase